MGDGIQIQRVSERFSSHTQARSRPIHGGFVDTDEKLITAIVDLLAEGGDPRLGQSRARP